MATLNPVTRGSVETDEAAITHSAGTFTAIAGQTGLQIVVFDIVLSMGGAGTFKFAGSSTGDLTGPFDVGAAGPALVIAGGLAPVLWTQTAGEDLQIVSTSAAIHGWLTYAVIKPQG
jgi:hypothetical protein